MNNHNINFLERTFGELEKGIVPNVKDPYNIMASLGPKMREAVLHNPSGYLKDDVCQILALDGDVVVGATNPFSGRLYINGEVVPTLNGSYLFSHEDYRKDNIGGSLFLRETKLHPSGNTFFAGISKMAMPLYHALRFTVFEIPRLIYLRKSRCVIQSFLHSEGWWTKPIICFVDLFLLIHRAILKIITSLRLRNYKVVQSLSVPKEVEEIVLNEGHPFMELHDKAWFEWGLQYSISEDERTKRRLFIILHNDKIEGFILTKQEFFETASSKGFKNVYLGSVMEWGISKESKLMEKDIALLSLSCFDKTIDGIQYASSDQKTITYLKKCLYVKVGDVNFGFLIKSHKDKELKNIENWRLRIAASDTLLN